MISALQVFKLCTSNVTAILESSPHLSLGELYIEVCLVAPAGMFKVGCDGPIMNPCYHFTGFFQSIGLDCHLNNIWFPAMSSVLPKISGGVRITFIEVVPYLFVTTFISTDELMKWVWGLQVIITYFRLR